MASRDGKLTSLFFLSKIVDPHADEEDLLLAPARKEAARLAAEIDAGAEPAGSCCQMRAFAWPWAG
ncbi:hypothetical protein ACIQU4_12130 [Streptomyces sp. NPDC090741]|uniref:hypothetical protein n=1 Tax=Streptomyces sp. NPDC090741 TaxID=3365967 RepID=UPI0038208291